MHLAWLFFAGSCDASFADFGDEEPHKSMTWIWGEAANPVRHALSVKSAFPDTGVIRISASSDCLYLNLVKRPPANIYPADKPFCQRFLPVAIQWFAYENKINISTLVRMEVMIDADPGVAACKCYLRVMAAFGFTKIGSKDLSRTDQDIFCETVPSNILVSVIATKGDAPVRSINDDSEAWTEIMQIVPMHH